MSIKTARIILGVIILVGLFIRVYRLAQVPVSLYWDETAIAYDAFSLSTTGQDMHGKSFWQPIFLSYGDYKAPVYIWLTTMVMKVFGANDWVVRLPSAVAGTTIILLAYALVVEMWRKKEMGLWVAGAMAIMPGEILFSRTGFEAHLGLLLVLATVYLWFLAGKKPWAFSLSGLTAAIGVYSYFSVRVVVPLLFIGFSLLYRKQVIKAWKWVLMGILLFGLLLIPLYQSSDYAASNLLRLSTPSLINTDNHILAAQSMREATGNTLLSRIVYHRWWFLSLRLLQNLSAHLNPQYLFFSGDSNLRHGTGAVGILLPLTIPLFITGLIYLMRKHTKEGLFLAYWWLAALVPASIPLVVPHALRSQNSLPVLGIFTGMGAYLAWTRANKLFRRVIFVYLILVLVSFGILAEDYLSHYPMRSAEAWQYQETKLAQEILGARPEATEIVVKDPPSRFYLYLLWQGKISPKEIYKWNGAEPIGFGRYKMGNQ